MKYLALIFFISTVNIAFAADSGGGSDSDTGSGWDNRLDTNTEMTRIRKLIASERYRYAITLLHDVVLQEYRNADAWNLMGYSYRKMGKLKKAGKAYRKALKYNPEHKGALEYQGELFIELQDFDKARANLASLEVLCPDGCEQLSDLKAALSHH